MPKQEPSPPQQDRPHRFKMEVEVFGPIRPSDELHRHTQRALKGGDVSTEITLHDGHNNAGMRVEYTVEANSPTGAERAGAVYRSQLCDLLSVVTRSPVWFYMPDEDSRDERIKMNRRTATVARILTKTEWSWITGNLVFLRREHPQFVAAASWYRKGLMGRDSLDDFCCFWKVIERLASHYADRSRWTDEEKRQSHATKCIDFEARERAWILAGFAGVRRTDWQKPSLLSRGFRPGKPRRRAGSIGVLVAAQLLVPLGRAGRAQRKPRSDSPWRAVVSRLIKGRACHGRSLVTV